MKPWQVCSLELAKKLKELNVKQESAFYWMPDFGTTWEYSLMNASFAGSWKGHFVPKDGRATTRDEDMRPAFNYIFAAFTVAELGCILPGNAYTRQHPSGDCFVCFWDGVKEFSISGDTEADARAKMMIYLIEKGVVDVVEVNKRLQG